MPPVSSKVFKIIFFSISFRDISEDSMEEHVFSPWMSGNIDEGKSSGVILGPRVRITARSIAFSSSRILPGQGYCTKRVSTESVHPVMCRWFARLYFSIKDRVSKGISSFLLRRGGREGDADHIQPIIKIFSEPVFQNFRCQDSVGG